MSLGKFSLLSAALTVFAMPSAATTTARMTTIDSGGGIAKSAGNCFRMTSALGEPAAGLSANGPLRMRSAFVAVARSDSLFRGNFESCT